jgi:hypothetical protein
MQWRCNGDVRYNSTTYTFATRMSWVVSVTPRLLSPLDRRLGRPHGRQADLSRVLFCSGTGLYISKGITNWSKENTRAWKWRQHVPPKRRWTSTGLYGVIFQMIILHSHLCEHLKSSDKSPGSLDVIPSFAWQSQWANRFIILSLSLLRCPSLSHPKVFSSNPHPLFGALTIHYLLTSRLLWAFTMQPSFPPTVLIGPVSSFFLLALCCVFQNLSYI